MAFYGQVAHVICFFDAAGAKTPASFDPKKAVFYEGVAVPVTGLASPSTNPIVKVEIFNLVKLFRGEFSGLRSSGYADGEMVVRYNIGNEQEAHIELMSPSSRLSPKRMGIAGKRNQRKSKLEMALSGANNRSIQDELELPIDTNTVKLGQSGSELWQRESNFIDSIFDNYYRGYLDK